MPSLKKQRFVGLFLFVLGLLFTYFGWETAVHEGVYRKFSSMFFPAFAVLGFGLLAFPIDGKKLKEKFGVDKPQTIKQYPAVWKIILIIAILAGILNRYLISGGAF